MGTCKCNPKFFYISKETFDNHKSGQAHIDMMMHQLRKDVKRQREVGSFGWDWSWLFYNIFQNFC